MMSGPAGTVVKTFMRLDPKILEGFKNIPTATIADCYQKYIVLSERLAPLNKAVCRCVGYALTVEEIEGGNFMSLLGIEYANPQDILVVDAKGIRSRAGIGALNAEAFKRKGGNGIIVYGSVRDTEHLSNLGIPVFCLGSAPAGPHKGVHGNVNGPIAIGSAIIRPGDILVADCDGVVCIPKEDALSVLKAANDRLILEKVWMEQIIQGKTFAQILGITEGLNDYNIKVIEPGSTS